MTDTVRTLCIIFFFFSLVYIYVRRIMIAPITELGRRDNSNDTKDVVIVVENMGY